MKQAYSSRRWQSMMRVWRQLIKAIGSPSPFRKGKKSTLVSQSAVVGHYERENELLPSPSRIFIICSHRLAPPSLVTVPLASHPSWGLKAEISCCYCLPCLNLLVFRPVSLILGQSCRVRTSESILQFYLRSSSLPCFSCSLCERPAP